jgi:hypothetical protein
MWRDQRPRTAARRRAVERNLMRQIILGSLAAATIAFVFGCGSKPAAPQATEPTSESKPQTTAETTPPVEEAKPAKNLDAKIEATWESKLRYQANTPPTNCAVAGRVRLFAADKETPQKGDGQVSILLYDHTLQSSAGEPLLIEEWRIDADSLKHFLVEDAAAPVYSFVLPWSTYKPEITQVQMEVKYEPKSGKTLSTKSDVLTLDHSEMKEAAK